MRDCENFTQCGLIGSKGVLKYWAVFSEENVISSIWRVSGRYSLSWDVTSSMWSTCALSLPARTNTLSSRYRQSTVQNTLAYLTLALDFGIWSHTKVEVQKAHLEQFSTILSRSNNTRYNAKHKLAKLGVVRKMLFVLQTSWYEEDVLPVFIQAMHSCLESNFTPEDAIKPVVAYMAAHLHSSTYPPLQEIVN